MNLKTVPDKTLIEKTENLAREERAILTSILHHLREIERRRLFSSLGYKSMFEFAVKHLGYAEDQAYRRLAAMRLLKKIPEIENKINQGEISLTHIGVAQTFFRQEQKIQQKEMTTEQKLSVLEKISHKSVREAERITLSLSTSPEPVKPDRITSLSESKIELKFSASQELQQKIEQLKGLLAHKNPDISLGELFDKLCDLGLNEWNPSKKFAAIKKSRVIVSNSKAQIRRDIFQNANNQCENCHSTFALEIDHKRPQAKGGSSDPQNLRVLCRHCNQRAAIQEFGQQKMDPYIN